MIDGLQASQQGKLLGSFLYYHFLYTTMVQARLQICLTPVQRCDQLYSNREASNDLFMQQAVFGFWVVITEGKISLCMPIHRGTYMRVSVYTWVHRNVDTLVHMNVWVYVFVNMLVCIIVVACGCIYSCVCLSTDMYIYMCIWIEIYIICVCMCFHVYVVGLYVYIHMYEYISVCICMGMYVGVYWQVDTFLCMHV